MHPFYIKRTLSYIGMSAVGTLGHFIAINKFGPSFIITIGIITEWLPKLLFYLVSGRITNRLGFKSTILITEFVKTITSLLIALLSSLLIVSDEYRLNIFYYLMISTNLAIYQMASALTNVAFETEVYYEEKEQSYKKVLSYAGLMRSEIVPSILFVPIIVFIAKDPIFIFYIGFLAHLSAFFYSKFTFMQIERAKVYSNLMDFRLDIIDGIKCIFKTIQIRILAILGVITTTYALTFSKISQTIFHFDNVLISQKMYVYSRSFSLAFVFFWSIYFSKKLLIKNNIESIIIKIHVIIIFTFLALLTVYQSYFNKSSFIFLVLCGLLLSVSENVFRIWQRSERQRHMDNQKRTHMTGIIISMESFGIIIGSLLLVFSGQSPKLFFSIFFTLFVVVLYYYKYTQKKVKQ